MLDMVETAWMPYNSDFSKSEKKDKNNITIIAELPNWLKKVKNKEWKYNFLDKKWKLISEEWFDYAYEFSEWYAAVKIEWKW